MKVILITDSHSSGKVIRAMLANSEIMVVDEDELPEDIEKHIHLRSRVQKLITSPIIELVPQSTRDVRPVFRNKVSDNFPKSKKRDRFSYSKRRP